MYANMKQEFLNDLEKLVSIDSYSYDPEGTGAVAQIMRAYYEKLGWHVTEHILDEKVGPALVITNKPDADTYDVLLLGHMDTVFKRGTAQERPFTVDGEYAYGPGVSDMKNGLLAGYYACRELQRNGDAERMAICICYNPDEEISSIYSRPLIEELGRKARYCIVLESARLNGNFVNERKGIGKYEIEFFGKAAHAASGGGANAINEFLLTGQEILSWANPDKGTTVNIGVVNGGTTPNTVPDYVSCKIDVRYLELAEAERMDTLIKEISNRMHIDGVTAKVHGGIARPPMKKSLDTEAWCKDIDRMAMQCGVSGEWESASGGSDGNFVGALGVPVIDGMGPAGGHWHSDKEVLHLTDLPQRLHLLYEVIKHCGSK